MAVVARVYIVRHGETDANREGIIQGHLDTALNAAGIQQARLVADALDDVPIGAAYTSDLQRARKVRRTVLSTYCKSCGLISGIDTYVHAPSILDVLVRGADRGDRSGEPSEGRARGDRSSQGTGACLCFARGAKIETGSLIAFAFAGVDVLAQFMGQWQGGLAAKRTNPPPDLEPLIDFNARGVEWWNKTVARHAQRKAAELRTKRGGCVAAGKTGSDGEAGKANGHTRELDGAEEMAELDFEPIHILAVSHGGLIGSLVTNLIGGRKVQAAEGVSTGWCYNASISVIDVEENGKGVLLSYADTTHLDGDVLQHNADVQLN